MHLLAARLGRKIEVVFLMHGKRIDENMHRPNVSNVGQAAVIIIICAYAAKDEDAYGFDALIVNIINDVMNIICFRSNYRF